MIKPIHQLSPISLTVQIHPLEKIVKGNIELPIPALYGTQRDVDTELPSKAALTMLADTLVFKWDVVGAYKPGKQVVQVAYQVLHASIPADTVWAAPPGLLYSGIVTTSVGPAGDSGEFELTNKAWKHVKWAAAEGPGTTPENFIATVYVRMMLVKDPANIYQVVAPSPLTKPSDCVQLIIWPA